MVAPVVKRAMLVDLACLELQEIRATVVNWVTKVYQESMVSRVSMVTTVFPVDLVSLAPLRRRALQATVDPMDDPEYQEPWVTMAQPVILA